MNSYLFIGGSCHGNRMHVSDGFDEWKVMRMLNHEEFLAEMRKPITPSMRDYLEEVYHRVRLHSSGVVVYTYGRAWHDWEILWHLIATFPSRSTN